MIREAFTRAAAKREGSSGIDFLEAILRERPDLRDKTAYFPEQGIYGHTVFIGNEVFKGPRSECHVPDFDREHQSLQQLSGKGLPIPAVTFVGKEVVFFGMTRMPGVVLGKNFEDRLTPDEQRVLARDIVGFVIDMACSLLPQYGEFVVHGDLNYNNILIDPVTKRLSAVVDFNKVNRVQTYQDMSVQVYARLSGADDDFGQILKKELKRRKAELPKPPTIKDTAPAVGQRPGALP